MVTFSGEPKATVSRPPRHGPAPHLRALLWVLVASATPATAEGPRSDWPQFLGPTRNAVSPEKGLNWDWKQKPPKVLWKAPLGNGFSSLAVVGERLFTQAKRGTRDIVVCLSTQDGRELWSYDAAPSYLDLQRQGAGPRATPTYQDGKVYCLFGQGELVCLTADGNLVWQKSIFKDTGAVQPTQKYFYFGVSSSPLVEGDLVIVQPGGAKDNSVVAFHKDNGRLVWGAGSDPIGYASPITITAHGSRQLVCPTGACFLGLDPSKGSVLWRYPFGNSFNTNCANPVWADDLLFVSAAYATGCAAVDISKNPAAPQTPPLANGEGGPWQAKEKWRDKKIMQNLFATSIILDKKIYGCSGDLRAFFLRCLDLETGKMNWEERLSGRVHLLAVDGHILIWEEHGHLRSMDLNSTAYVRHGDMPELLRFKCWAAPALASGKLYLRDDDHVLCLDLRK